MHKKDPLGRGLSAILRDVDEGNAHAISVQQILVNPNQPRVEMKQESLQELAASIQEKGLLQPILVRRKEGAYEIIAGERRFRAAKMAGLKESCNRQGSGRPGGPGACNDRERAEGELNAVEIANVYHRFVEEFGYTHEELAKKVGSKELGYKLHQAPQAAAMDTGHCLRPAS